MACGRCVELCQAFDIRTPRDLRMALDVVGRNVGDGTLAQIDVQDGSKTAIESLGSDGPIPDFIEMNFYCTTCGERVRLVSENYHGAGGRWSCSGQKS